LTQPFVEALRIYGSRNSVKTIRGRTNELKVGLVAYLHESGMGALELESMDRTFWRSFINWLDKKPGASSGETIQPKSRSLLFGATSALLRCLRESAAYRQLAIAAHEAQPVSRWSSEETQTTPYTRLHVDDIRKIDAVVTAELRELEQRLEARDSMIRRGKEKLLASPADLSTIDAAVAYVAATYPHGLPSNKWIAANDEVLHRVVKHSNCKGFIGQERIRAVLYPSMRDMVPLMLALALETALNAETLLRLKWSDIRDEELFGEPIVSSVVTRSGRVKILILRFH